MLLLQYYSSKYLDDVLDKAEKLKLSKEDTLATITGNDGGQFKSCDVVLFVCLFVCCCF